MDGRLLEAVVADAGTTSAAVALGGRDLVGVYLPAGLDGTTLGFTACATADGTFLAVTGVGGGSAISYTVAASRYVPLDPAVFRGVSYLKVVLATQTGAYTASLVLA